jgi:hypothetical protein
MRASLFAGEGENLLISASMSLLEKKGGNCLVPAEIDPGYKTR